MRTAQTDTSFDGREGRNQQGFLPLLGDLNNLALSWCLPAGLAAARLTVK